MNIVEAIKDEKLLRPFFGDEPRTWTPWLNALRCLYGIPVTSRGGNQLVQRATGRGADTMPEDGFDTALFLTGRRSGKSRIAATVAAFEAVLAGHQTKLSKGERGVVACLAPSRGQSGIVRDYVRGVFDLPMFRPELAKETSDGFALRCGTTIQILTGDWRTVRGRTLLAAIVDEVCFFGLEDLHKVNDTELIRALQPSLATTGGKLVAISSPYARRGWAYGEHKRNHGNPDGRTLVWQAASRTMNPTLSQAVVDRALAEDPAAARAEYLAQWRDDVETYITEALVRACIAEGVPERLPRTHVNYVAFADLSGGRADDAALAIAHRDGRQVVLDYARRWRPPFDPRAVINAMCEVLRRYECGRVTGDNYAAEFVAGAFTGNGIRYKRSDKPKSQLYVELLPRLCSQEIHLLDDDVLVSQLSSLERRTRAGGKDIIDHAPGGHDDLCNAVAGVATVAATPAVRVGALNI